ncbi:hypothetical protein E2C01_079323 [Portunus trituberculatus]|uniref:Uncharacterized protein n=1 Tax=Portunus trituberculatus TaxID=210409 RepID=A0A5B7IGN9_PORTR|nr:hypothetical protein [Portunus trituberculatus]
MSCLSKGVSPDCLVHRADSGEGCSEERVLLASLHFQPIYSYWLRIRLANNTVSSHQDENVQPGEKFVILAVIFYKLN